MSLMDREAMPAELGMSLTIRAVTLKGLNMRPLKPDVLVTELDMGLTGMEIVVK